MARRKKTHEQTRQVPNDVLMPINRDTFAAYFVCLTAILVAVDIYYFGIFDHFYRWLSPAKPFSDGVYKEIVEKYVICLNPSIEYDKTLTRALYKADLNWQLDQIFNQPFRPIIKFVIASDQDMMKLTNLPENTAFTASNKNLLRIYLNEFMFDGKPCRIQQLVNVLRNEMLHALTAIHHQATSYVSHFNVWHNHDELALLQQAKNAFMRRVSQPWLQKLTPTTAEQTNFIERFKEAILLFRPKALGADCDTVMNTFISKGKSLNIYLDKKATLPPLSDTFVRIEYLTEAFMRTWQSLTLHSVPNSGFYSQQGSKERLIDFVSDFMELPKQLRQLLGPELCEYLNDFFNTDALCMTGSPTFTPHNYP